MYSVERKFVKTAAFKGEEKWYLVNAKGAVLGRIAAKIAARLRGKHLSTFTPNQNMGAHVVVINADQVVLTSKKISQKTYYHHSGYIGGLKSVRADTLLREKPTRVMTYAVTGMLPKNKLGEAMAKRLRVYAGDTHPHYAQQPEIWKI